MRIIVSLFLAMLFVFSVGCSEDDPVFPSQKDTQPWPSPDKGVAGDQSQAEDTAVTDQAPAKDVALDDVTLDDATKVDDQASVDDQEVTDQS